ATPFFLRIFLYDSVQVPTMGNLPTVGTCQQMECDIHVPLFSRPARFLVDWPPARSPGGPPMTSTIQRFSLCNDVVFKALFCRHPDLLSDLINQIRHPAAPIQVRQILNPTILPEDLVGKHVVLDILAEDETGRRFGVEMQLQ